jgi:hypothetical protein
MGISSALGSDALLPGLVLVKSQTVGSAVASVEVTGAFNGTYDNYRIVYNGGTASVLTGLSIQMGSTQTGYYSVTIYAGFTSGGPSVVRDTNATKWTYAGSQATNAVQIVANISAPYLATRTTIFSEYTEFSSTSNAGITSGFLDNSTQYTAFTLLPSSGTLTGGTIRVYGYRNS